MTIKGSENPAEIYLSVGLALSWWEGSEDILMGVFLAVCGDKEPTAFEAYVDASRSTREKMLKSALKRHPNHFLPEEEASLRDALGKLNELAKIRNQIAHGHVATQRVVTNDIEVMSGHFLVPSVNERGKHIQREAFFQRYALTAAQIDEWRDKVREQRGRIMDLHFGAIQRRQSDEAKLTPEQQYALSICHAVVNGTVSPNDVNISIK